jgi:hypothetical protein
LFPAGDDLQRIRGDAVTKLVPDSPEGKGVYRAAVGIARKRKDWEHIEQPLIASKFLRAFIWPSGLASLALLGNGLWQKGVGEPGTQSLLFGTALAIIFFLLFVPYINLRVEHMQRLYEHVSRSGSAR